MASSTGRISTEPRIEATMDEMHERVNVLRPFGWAMQVWT